MADTTPDNAPRRPSVGATPTPTPAATPAGGSTEVEIVPRRDLLEATTVPGGPPARPAPPGDAPPAVPGYEVHAELARGGMGVVYTARDLALKREVAVKTLLPGIADDPRVTARFVREAELTARLPHPGVPPVHAQGTLPDGRPFLAMKLITGRTLAAILADAARPPNLLAVFEAVCQTVGYAHSVGVIHRDLKPANVMVGAFGEVQVMDWGLAKEARNSERGTGNEDTEPDSASSPSVPRSALPDPSSEETVAGHAMGTPAYMPPEQANGQWDKVDARADVFALGGLLCALLTGQPAYVSKPGTSAMALAKTGNLADAFARLDACGADAELVALARRCLAPDPAARPADAGVVASLMAAHRAGVEDRLRAAEREAAVGVVERRKRRALQWAAGAVAAVLLLGIAGTTFGLIRADNRRVDAENARIDEENQRRVADIEKTNALNAAAAEKIALQKETAALQKETEERKYAEAIAAFVRDDFLALTSVDGQYRFAGADPVRLDRNLTLRQMLDRAAEKLDKRADLAPRTEADLRFMIGENYRGQGAFEPAIRHLERCTAIRRQTLGPNDPATLDAEDCLGVAYLDAGRLPEAIERHERVRNARVVVLGADHRDTLKTMSNLAVAYHATGRAAEAIELLEQVRDVSTTKLGADHPSTLITLNNLARTYHDAGRLPQAIKLFEQVRDIQLTKLEPDHPLTLTTLNNLANVYRDAGRLPQAIKLFEQVRDALVTKLGADHPDTLAALNNLGHAYRTVGRVAEAIKLLEPIRDAMVAKLGADHPTTLTALNNLAAAYMTAGRLPQAITLFEQVRDTQAAKLGADHLDTLTTLNNLAMAYNAVGRLPEAITLYERVRDAMVAKLGADHPTTIQALSNLAVAYRDAERLPEAIALLEQAATGIEKRRFQDASTGLILTNTITVYEEAKEFDKAIAWQRKWLAIVKQQAGADTPAYAGEVAALGMNLIHQRKWAEAETALRECLTIREKVQPTVWNTFNTMSMLGGALLGQQKYAEAEPLLVKGYEGLKQREKTIPPQGNTRIPEALDRLIEFYTATDKPDETAKWKAERAKYPDLAPPPRAVKR